MQLDAHVDGSSQGDEVVRANNIKFSVGPDMRQVEDLECKFTGLSWESKGDGEIEWQADSLLPLNQLEGCK